MAAFYAARPAPVMYDIPDAKQKNAVQQLLWGDEAQVQPDPPNAPAHDGWQYVRARKIDGWIRQEDLQTDPVLEMTWVDVGQGDSSLIRTPDGRTVIVDAGAGDALLRYLHWRFDKFVEPVTVDCAVITHGDADHYRGFTYLLEEPQITIKSIVHNGLVERPDAGLGAVEKLDGDYDAQIDLVRNDAELDALLNAHPNPSTQYLAMLGTARDKEHRATTAMVSLGDYLDGFEADKAISLQVLSPIVECLPDGQDYLPRFGGQDSYAKNGNSIVLMLRIGDLRIFLGGDLNAQAEERLLEFASQEPRYAADIAKACHHGTADVSDAFLQAIHPVATVISSGDEESYSHPRPDALGLIGLHSRGKRPLVFSTELARSSPERAKPPFEQIEAIVDQIVKANQPRKGETPDQTKSRIDKFMHDPGRLVASYGAIQLRTDGHAAVLAFKIERPPNNAHKWDLYTLEYKAAEPDRPKDWFYAAQRPSKED